MKAIDGQTSVGRVIMQKGMDAAKIIDKFFCLKSGCCAGTTHELGFAAKLRDKGGELPSLIDRLNSLPDVVKK